MDGLDNDAKLDANDLHANRAMLIALLLDMPLGPPATIDISSLSTLDKLFLLTTCCSQMIAEAVWLQSGAQQAEALCGIDALVEGIRANIKRRIDGQIDGCHSPGNSRSLVSISEHEFRAYAVFKAQGSPTTEKAWFRYGEYSEIVLIDNVDNDWSFVALADSRGQFRCVDVGTSFLTQAAATEALGLALQAVAAFVDAQPPGEVAENLERLMEQKLEALIETIYGASAQRH